MTLEDRRRAYTDAIRSVLGWSYEWGGQSDRGGFDCSGLVVWALRKANFRIADMNAAQMFDYWHPYKVIPSAALPGTLFFYWDERRNTVTHVMSVFMVWPNGTRILAGARGGTQETTTLDYAKRDNAFVDIVMNDHYWQGNFAMALDPFRSESDWI
jgi:cell wall-associated NlpC family hydrolase